MNDSTTQEFSDLRDDKRLQTLFVINRLLRKVDANGLDINKVLPRVLDIAVEQLQAEDGSIIVVNEEMLIQHAWLTKYNRHKNLNQRLENILAEGLAGWVIRHNEPSLIYDTATDERWYSKPGFASATGSWSVVCAPFVVQNKAIGAITLHKRGHSAFNQSDLDLLSLIADQASSTISHSNLYEQSRQQLRVTTLLNEASSIINASLDINEIMQQLLAQMNEFLKAEAISIAFVDQQTNELVYQAAEGIGADRIVGLRLPANEGLSGWVMEHGEPDIVTDITKDPRFKKRQGEKRTGYVTRQMICAPVKFKGRVLGTIQSINPLSGTFTPQDLDVLVSLANIASTAIENAQQFAQTQTAEARYTSLFQDSVDPIILTNLEGQIVEVNQRAIDLLGYAHQDLLAMSIQALHGEKKSVSDAEMTDLKDVSRFDTYVDSPTKQSRYHFRVYVKQIIHGQEALLQWIHHDITKQIQLEAIRQDLTAMLVHDLQSPLGNVISSLELIRYEVPEDATETMQTMLDIAVRSSHHLQTLVQSLLDISRLEAGHPITKQSVVAVQDLIQFVYEIEEPSLDKRGVTFVNAANEDVPPIFVEESMVRRVLLNLLDNALKYSENNRNIIVSARPYDETSLLLSVADQGQGIPESYRETIFEKFQRIRTNSSSKGLGLGLAFCKLAIEAHGGNIWVDETPGGGARFNFTLPIATAEQIDKHAAEQLAAEAQDANSFFNL